MADVERVPRRIETAIDRDGLAGRQPLAEAVEVGAVGEESAPFEILDDV
jgi:hypothetical protein